MIFVNGSLTQTGMEESMPGILDFLTDVGGDRNLSATFVGIVASPDCTPQDLMEFFAAHNYDAVTAADVAKIMTQRDNIKRDFNVPENVDY
jgi:hypothetical protein